MNEKRSLGLAVKRGFLGRCPNCGEGKLFGKFLKVVDECAVCHEPFRHHRADDAPAYLVILIVGHIVVPSALWVEQLFHPPYWLAFSIWIPLTLILALGLLQPMKGVIVGWQWAQRMHGFDPNHQDEIELMKDAR
ncbi:MAG: DUF983 domain-containing protein [Xanthobacteraceae bacterium]|nr:DUF983 domain-containing protein [Xanthobacteraceae bacterium]MBX3522711.1 DUF983 domain-containing protein [Xanthobacteraceae bacterium]MBX3534301.1 DUF983 domain-containing protein [Xanthobacteraceae bacterium]MBX3550106.1 DUF983 domain-containing protein [Xanthobacteraceae bacterium]MCW5676107.1 DUF983 domain-containing protein [Xanthobacteraceae bacterium]